MEGTLHTVIVGLEAPITALQHGPTARTWMYFIRVPCSLCDRRLHRRAGQGRLQEAAQSGTIQQLGGPHTYINNYNSEA